MRVIIGGKKFERGLFAWPSFSQELRMILPTSSHDKDYFEKVQLAMGAIEKAAALLEREEVTDIKTFAALWESRPRHEPDFKRRLKEYIAQLNTSGSTRRIYEGRAKAICSIFGEVFVYEIDVPHLEAIDAYFMSKKRTRASAKLCHALLSGFLRWANKKGLTKKTPYALFRCAIKKKEEKRHTIEHVAVEALFAAFEQKPEGASRNAMRLYLLQCYTGARYSDATNLSKSDFDKGYYIAQKTGKRSMLFLSNRLALLCPAEKIGLNYNAFRKLLIGISATLGHDYTRTHAARRYFATEVFNKANYNIKVVQQALGHNSITTTERYISQDGAELQKAVMSLGE